MTPRSQQLQIRVTATEKAAIKRRARNAGLDVSAYVLARALPDLDGRVAGIVAALRDDCNLSFALAEFQDLLAELAPMDFGAALERVDVRGLTPYVQNYVAAMVEQAASAAGAAAPAWTRDIAPLDAPYFATLLRSARLYLLCVTPVAFRRRNIFTESRLGDRP